MAKVHRIRSKEEAERQASAWITRLTAEDVSAEDRTKFEAWRAGHPQNARAYEAVAGTWSRLIKSGHLVRAVSFSQAMDVAAVPPRFARHWLLGGVAASLAAIGMFTAAYWWQSRSETLFQTAVGESASISLPDGSSLELNSNSLASVDFDPHRRIIHLQRGEAFFTVTHDPQRPFWVVAGRSWVRAVGTAFNVYLRPTDVEVTVSEGTVKVTSQEAARQVPSDEALAETPVSILKAGDQADLGKQTAMIRTLPPPDLRRSMAWRQGTLYFENRPLSEVVAEMSRYTSLKLEIEDDPTLRQLPIGATFHANPQGAEALLTMLEGLGLQVSREERQRALIARRPDQQ